MGFFEIVNNELNMTSVEAKSAYVVNVTAAGTNVFEDGNNWLMVDVTVTGVGNTPPSIDAGPDQRVLDGSAVALNGTALDADGNSMTYSWAQTGGPPMVALTGSDTLSLTFTAPDVSSDVQLTFQLTVNDGTDSVTDDVTVTIHDAAADFVTTWDVTIGLTIPVGGTGGGYDVDWGDGTFNSGWSGTSSHIYDDPGTYTVRISGDFPNIRLFDRPADATKLQSIEQWGDIGWTSMGSAFYGASNMEYNAADVPDLSLVTDMGNMFHGANAFDGDLSEWDVSGVTNMRFMFYDARAFDGDISGWDVSGVTSMERMFDNADAFDGDLSEWDVSNVQHMDAMFRHTLSFNQDISSWDVSSVTQMSLMFDNTNSFNQPLDSWDVSGVQNMGAMFRDTVAFDRPLDSWDVSNVQNMDNMFRGAVAFNQDISSWDVSSVTSMVQMFYGADSFEQNLGEWYVTLDDTIIVRTDVPGVVGSISAQNGVLDGHSPTYGIGESDDKDLFEIVNGNGLNMTSVGTGSAYEVNVTASGSSVFENGNNWRMVDVTVTGVGNNPPSIDAGPDQRVLDGSAVALNGTALDADGDSMTYSWAQTGGLPAVALTGSDTLSPTFTAPDVSSDIQLTFRLTVNDGTDSVTDDVTVTIHDAAADFVTTWDVTIGLTIPVRGTGDYDVDWGDGKFDSGWSGTSSHGYDEPGTYEVRISGDFPNIFLFQHSSAPKLQSIEQWGDIGWTDMEGAFHSASSMEYAAADAPDLSSVTDMGNMFAFTGAFGGNLSGWDVSGVTSMQSVFLRSGFNGDISGWDVSSVTNMITLFQDAPSFDSDISSWDVSSVRDMTSMFLRAAAFNQPLNSWDVSNVQNMGAMFRDADSFNQDISSWDVSSVTSMSIMFEGADSFNQDISSWDVSSVTSMVQMFDDADSFQQNLGEWYVTLDDAIIARTDVPGVVGSISAQNGVLDGHSPTYGIGTGGDSAFFEIVNNELRMTSVEAKSAYVVNVTASGTNVFEDGNNWREVDVRVTADSVDPPTTRSGGGRRKLEAGARAGHRPWHREIHRTRIDPGGDAGDRAIPWYV